MALTILALVATNLTPSVAAEPARIALPVAAGSTVEGLVTVNGHDIYGRCAGDGSPTVVYFTGWADGPAKRAVEIATRIEPALGPDVRLCSYERRNTGRSQRIDGTQTPEDVVSDVDGFLEALGEEGPFVLLGASFGGLVATTYALAHPDRVAGVVLLDASTGADYDIEEMLGFQGACLESNRKNDAWFSWERLDNCALMTWIHDHAEQQPNVPLLFLASASSEDRGWIAGDAKRALWVRNWSPGEWRLVDAPHWMDDSDPALVARAVRDVMEAATASPSPS